MATSATLSSSSARGEWNPLSVAALAALWITALANWPLWRELARLPEMASVRGTLFMAAFGVMVAALTLLPLTLAAWRMTVKPVAALFIVSAALGAHFMGSYGTVIDKTMMTNVLQTDPAEVRDLMSWRLLLSVVVLAALPLMWLWRVRLRHVTVGRQLRRITLAFVASFAVLALLMFVSYADLSATMRNHKSIRYLINPINSFIALGGAVHDANARPKGPPDAIGLDAKVATLPAGSRPPLVVLVVGETARADHFSLNGYARPTNPELATAGVVSFSNATSCGTSTAASLPCMFSHLGKAGFDSRDRDHENLLDLVQRAGLAVLWLDNQSGCKGLCSRVPNAFARDAAPGADALSSALCNAGECLDEALLVGLDARLAALPVERRSRGVLLVLHQMGSHGPEYFKRSPPGRKPFMPECTTNVLQQCGQAPLVNAYDNSIAYTDHVLALTLKWLQGQSLHYDPAFLYVSDHGESLGENNLYLHGLPFSIAPASQKHVPWVMWLPGAGSSAEARSQVSGPGVTPECLATRRNVPVTHDNLFHTVLGLLGISAAEYRSGLDALAACRAG